MFTAASLTMLKLGGNQEVLHQVSGKHDLVLPYTGILPSDEGKISYRVTKRHEGT